MKKLGNSLILLLTATIWGVAFVAQSAGMEYVGGFTFNSVRSIIGAAVLIPVLYVMVRKGNGSDNRKDGRADKEAGNRAGFREVFNRELLTGGICCGIALTLATNLQQHGIKYTSVGKAGFITALYIVLVPVFGLFLHKKVGRTVWVGLAIAVTGLYFLCINGDFKVGMGDLLVLGCAAIFAVHILVVDHFAPRVNCVAMSCVQFLVCGILSGIPAILFESISLDGMLGATPTILYAGVLSCGVAYTLQMVGQKNMNPTVASMILSLESVISVLAGLLLLGQKLSPRELLGCVLMSSAVILCQLPTKEKI